MCTFNFDNSGGQGTGILPFERHKIGPGTNLSIILIPPLQLLGMSSQMAIHKAEVRRVEPQPGTDASLVAKFAHDAGADSVHRHVAHVFVQLRPEHNKIKLKWLFYGA